MFIIVFMLIVQPWTQNRMINVHKWSAPPESFCVGYKLCFYILHIKQKSQEISTAHITPDVTIPPIVTQYCQSFLVEMADLFMQKLFFVICLKYDPMLYFSAPCSGSSNCPFVCWTVTWSSLLQCWKWCFKSTQQ